MITFSKQEHLKDIEAGRDFKLNLSRYWLYPFVKKQIDFKDKDILDVGGGNCCCVDYLQDSWDSYDILDKDKNGCTTKAQDNYFVKDITKETLDKKYDIILCLSVLEHIENWKQVLKNIDSLLRIDGNLVLVVDIFSEHRQFSLSQIPELLTQLKNYDLGEIDLSMDNLWSKKFAKKEFNFHTRNSSADITELYIEGQKKSEMNIQNINKYFIRNRKAL